MLPGVPVRQPYAGVDFFPSSQGSMNSANSFS
jgi:hypothetical protein